MNNTSPLFRSAVLQIKLNVGGVSEKHLLQNRASRVTEGFFVVTLSQAHQSVPENVDKLREFMSASRSMCRGATPEWTVVNGYEHQTKGVGITKAFIDILEEAHNQNLNVAYIFEDDARFLNHFLCDHRFRKDLWAETPNDTYVLVFAGHHVHLAKDTPILTQSFVYISVAQLFGAYAWAVRREHFLSLASFWKEGLISTNESQMVSPDVELATSRPDNTSTYLLRVPQIAEHPPSWSQTWNKMRPKPPDIECLTLIVYVENEEDADALNTFRSCAEILCEIIVIMPANIYEPYLTTNNTGQSINIERYLLRNETLDLPIEIVEKALSNTLAIMDRTTSPPSREDLYRFRSQFLKHPYDVFRQKYDGGVFDYDIILVQRRFMVSYISTATAVGQNLSLFEDMENFISFTRSLSSFH